MRMKAWIPTLVMTLACVSVDRAAAQTAASTPVYLGFDRNDYPGDANLKVLREYFFFSGYWLNAPPGETTTSWAGKRNLVRDAGFGFLVLFNGRLDAELKKSHDPGELGRSDATAAIAAAQFEGFPPHTVIFLDVEEGGRMLPEQKAYIYAWVDGVNAAGFRAGVYCSGIPAPEARGVTVITADDLRQNAKGRTIAYWVSNDACPPSPGCAYPKRAPPPSKSGVTFAQVWQFAQSPKRADFAAGCHTTYAPDGNCYPPRPLAGAKVFVDLDSADREDPSGGR
jgi:hypothetical protein